MFEVKTSHEKLRLLMDDYKKLIAEPLDVSLAEKCCQDAWHLADWDLKDRLKLDANLDTKSYREVLYARCPEMKILHVLRIR